ncbi:MAG: hypothetical protein PF549_01180 [Patescibacteria group bacterium]|jgi:hypothetical protein|nr:hypothetical protein [Patescibacteria group bacterium]
MFKKIICVSFFIFFCLFTIKINTSLAATTTFGSPFGITTVEQFFLSIIENLKNVLALISILFIVVGGIFYITAGGVAERIKTAKNLWVGAIIGLFVALLAPTFLQAIRANFLKNNVLPSTMEEALTLTDIITNVLGLLLSIIGILAIISLVVSGLTYIFSFGDSSRAEKAKEMIKWSIVGLALAGASVIIVRQIAVLAS